MTGFAIALLIAPVLPLLAVLILLPHNWRSASWSLRERTFLALRDLGVSSFVALLAAEYLFDLGLSGEGLGIVYAIMLLLIALPSGVWVILWLRGAFR